MSAVQNSGEFLGSEMAAGHFDMPPVQSIGQRPGAILPVVGGYDAASCDVVLSPYSVPAIKVHEAAESSSAYRSGLIASGQDRRKSRLG